MSLLKDDGTPVSAIMSALAGRSNDRVPVWMMRQAGRYLPEYRAIRSEVPSFLDLCYTPKLATEITLQPIRRFGLDAAILFSDILVVPDALGQAVRFVAGEGPRLDPITEAGDLGLLDPGRVEAHLAPVLETVGRVRAELDPEVALLGFCGAPWTVATYMVAGAGSPDQRAARLWAYRDPEGFGRLIDILVETSIVYLARQLEAGADAVQIFDTWAGSLGDGEFERWAVEPARRIVEGVRDRVPGARVIGFPRGAGLRAADYARGTGIDAVGIDWMMPLEFARKRLQTQVAVQGNLDPLVLLAGGPAMDEAVDRIMAALSGGPFIFNLGHGIVPETPVEHVERMLARVRGER